MASDGKNSIEQMRDQAIKRGLSYISINDHSKSAFYAGGQSEKALFQQLTAIKKINLDKKAKDCFLFSGVESDILYDGSLDYHDKILRKLDIVIASVHSQLKMNALAMTNRMINGAANPWTTIIGHPTGRRLLKRPESKYDLNAFFEVCKKHNVAVELNGHPERLDLNDRYLAMAKEWGLLIAIDTDAHSLGGLDFLEYGIVVARRAHLTIDDVLNAKPLDELKAWLNEKRRIAAIRVNI
jgi:DNA polymerase (family 10)